MNFPISQNKFTDLARFNAKFGVRNILLADCRISIFLDGYSIELIDSERYMHIIKCELKFNAEISFFIEDVAKAIEGEFSENRFQINDTNADEIEEILWNDDYLDRVFLFFEEHGSTLLAPGRWFKEAVEVANNRLARNFSELSKNYLQINAHYFEDHFR
jgi:hypothetical protein